MIPYGRQDVNEDDIDAVVDVLRSEFLTQGPVVPRFESVVAAYCGAAQGVAVNSATSALHLACLALGLGPGDWLWTSPITFVASANCGLYCGAQVDFVDIDPKTYTLSVPRLAEKLEHAQRHGTLPKVVVPVHLCGQSCDMAGIHALAQRYGFRVIEDAAHALGGRYRDEPIGCCRYSDITVFSFHPVKLVTTGEGGVAVTNHPEWAQRMRLLRSHGITRDAEAMTHAPDGPWYYQQIDLGYNYRMTEFQAALGLSQMARLDAFVARRREIAQRYDEAFADLPLVVPFQAQECWSAYHLYVIALPESSTAAFHREVFDRLRELGVGVNLHYIPVHTQPVHLAKGFRVGDFPMAEAYYQRAITLPIYPSFSNSDQERVIRCVQESLR